MDLFLWSGEQRKLLQQLWKAQSKRTVDLQLRSEEHREFLQQLREEKTGINKTKGMEDPFAVIVHSFFDGRASLIQQ